MGTLTNSPRTETVLALEARKSFALGLNFYTAADESPVDITGCTVRFVMGAKRKGGATVLTETATIIDGPLGVCQFELQATDLNLATGEYPFSVTLVSALGYSTQILKGVVDVLDNPDTSTSGTYAGISPSTNLAAYLEDGALVEVRIDSVDGMAVVVADLLADAAAQAAQLIAAVEGVKTQTEAVKDEADGSALAAGASATSAAASATSAAAAADLARELVINVVEGELADQLAALFPLAYDTDNIPFVTEFAGVPSSMLAFDTDDMPYLQTGA